MSSKQYWNANLKLICGCLLVWFLVSYGFGLMFVDWLNQIRLGGFMLGFWFAQQGSIFVFVLVLIYYAWRMKRLDAEYLASKDRE